VVDPSGCWPHFAMSSSTSVAEEAANVVCLLRVLVVGASVFSSSMSLSLMSISLLAWGFHSGASPSSLLLLSLLLSLAVTSVLLSWLPLLQSLSLMPSLSLGIHDGGSLSSELSSSLEPNWYIHRACWYGVSLVSVAEEARAWASSLLLSLS
jgi:hypothetical protein